MEHVCLEKSFGCSVCGQGFFITKTNALRARERVVLFVAAKSFSNQFDEPEVGVVEVLEVLAIEVQVN